MTEAREKKYGELAIEQCRLEAWENSYPERDYLIALSMPEFTCLCPRSGFPDFATINIRYIPDRKVVELKSLKLYINGYRGQYISHENAVNKILTDLVDLLDPRWMEVVGDFSVRGNIKTVITATHTCPGFVVPRDVCPVSRAE
ncbi:MAG: NADPH-dependent 7-cyano-7-deazaguanine reductase QueF [Chloroflexota bacterium]|nr:MAG: NADPH-dependent 7-cyano-7-deazaguanine reductase QueF [Chloroflexota bacterium]